MMFNVLWKKRQWNVYILNKAKLNSIFFMGTKTDCKKAYGFTLNPYADALKAYGVESKAYGFALNPYADALNPYGF